MQNVIIEIIIMFHNYAIICIESESMSHSVMSNSLRPHGLWPSGILCP